MGLRGRGYPTASRGFDRMMAVIRTGGACRRCFRARWVAGAVIAVMSLVLACSSDDTPTPVPRPSSYADPSVMVDTAWLVQHTLDQDVRVIALMPKDTYDAAHIPNSIQVDWPEFAIADGSAGGIEASP